MDKNNLETNDEIASRANEEDEKNLHRSFRYIYANVTAVNNWQKSQFCTYHPDKITCKSHNVPEFILNELDGESEVLFPSVNPYISLNHQIARKKFARPVPISKAGVFYLLCDECEHSYDSFEKALSADKTAKLNHTHYKEIARRVLLANTWQSITLMNNLITDTTSEAHTPEREQAIIDNIELFEEKLHNWPSQEYIKIEDFIAEESIAAACLSLCIPGQTPLLPVRQSLPARDTLYVFMFPTLSGTRVVIFGEATFFMRVFSSEFAKLPKDDKLEWAISLALLPAVGTFAIAKSFESVANSKLFKDMCFMRHPKAEGRPTPRLDDSRALITALSTSPRSGQ